LKNSNLKCKRLAISRYTKRAVSKTIHRLLPQEPFQSRTTSPSCYPSPPRCVPLPRHERMAFSGLIKARERPETREVENTKKRWREKETRGSETRKRREDITQRHRTIQRDEQNKRGTQEKQKQRKTNK